MGDCGPGLFLLVERTGASLVAQATLTFTLPEERLEHLAAIHGLDLLNLVSSVMEELRSRLKHGGLRGPAVDELERIRQLLVMGLNELPSELTGC